MTHSPLRRIGWRAVLTAAVAAFLTFSVQSGAVADDGVRTYTIDCDLKLGNSPVNAHIGIRNCTLVFGKNIIDDSHWQTLKFDMIDNMTDGYCARTESWEWRSGNYWYAKECNGVWRTKTHTWSGWTYGVGLSIGWGPGDKWSTWVGYDHDEWPTPPGF
jgi:hypothetical protein